MFTSISTFKNPTQITIYNLGKNVKNKQTCICICISTMVAMECVLQYSRIQYHGQANVHGKMLRQFSYHGIQRTWCPIATLISTNYCKHIRNQVMNLFKIHFWCISVSFLLSNLVIPSKD